MIFTADFHIHSRYSRATSRHLDLEHLYIAAQIKGIGVIGTGDFTHPLWWEEITTKLVPAEEGLFALDPQIARGCDEQVPAACRRPVRFMLVTEISNIYKKGDRTRKNHNLVFMPDMPSALDFNQKLDRIGNIRSDGRPILGLDARTLLEITLETSPNAYLVPAHIWTPWFSLLGSKSGFDSVEACFEDLSDHIFAVETGLSSDPAMNWRFSGLDRFTLISNSDAHSPGKLGREANLFNVEPGFTAIREALETAHPDRFLGTVEFYPEEGKYHVDGHRKCGFSCLPGETHRLKGNCPVCGKPLVLGVLHRVEALADREEGARPPKAKPYECLIPLEEVLAETLQSGANTQRVQQSYRRLTERHGSEFEILRRVPIEDLARSGIALFSEAVARMRSGRVIFDPGYDGEFGRVRLFDANERRELSGQTSLFALPDCETREQTCPAEHRELSVAITAPDDLVPPRPSDPDLLQLSPMDFALNAAQQQVVDHTHGPMIVSAGPGTGKTRTITCRMAVLIQSCRVSPESILAVTFTNKAAREMSLRLAATLADGVQIPTIATFHGFCRQLLKLRETQPAFGLADDSVRQAVMADAIDQVQRHFGEYRISPAAAIDFVVAAKQQLLGHEEDLNALVPSGESAAGLKEVYRHYQRLLQLQALFDFEDLIFEVVSALEADPDWRRHLQARFSHIFVDEFQDINHGQYRLIRLLAPAEADVCVIGDPDQAIYGFRGSDVRYFTRFVQDYPKVRKVRLSRNYRSTETILRAAYQSLRGRSESATDGETGLFQAHCQGGAAITMLESATPRAEAVAIGRCIEQTVGGTGFHAIDFGKIEEKKRERSFADFAVLYRTGEQGRLLAEVLRQAGIPCQLASRETLGQQPGMVRLMAMLRVVSSCGSFADLNHLTDIVAPGIGRDTLALFKVWAYAVGLPLERALHTAVRLPIQGMSTPRQQRLVSLIRLIYALRKDGDSQTVPAVIERVLDRTVLSNQIEFQARQALLATAVSYGYDLHAFLDGQVLQSDTDLYRPEAERVALMTMHAAKGLEFPVVFVAGCEAGLIPYHPPGKAKGDIDEERRLLFVAMTRAKESLYLSWVRKRTLYGQTGSRQASPFLNTIDPLLLEQLAASQKRRGQQQLQLF